MYQIELLLNKIYTVSFRVRLFYILKVSSKALSDGRVRTRLLPRDGPGHGLALTATANNGSPS